MQGKTALSWLEVVVVEEDKSSLVGKDQTLLLCPVRRVENSPSQLIRNAAKKGFKKLIR